MRLYMLAANGEPISIQYTLVFGNTACWRLPARVATSELEKFGLGRIELIKMIEALIAECVRTIEAGPGHYDYRQGTVELSCHYGGSLSLVRRCYRAGKYEPRCCGPMS